jgi:Cu(I)/Ag(I) efflux system membrane protein CusA/SilA
VATTVAGLLPIMWSTTTGSEVMRPLAAPVIGGMLSSLVHILIVTPVLFAWLREGEIKNMAPEHAVSRFGEEAIERPHLVVVGR